jgi:hypothetical protein
MKRMAKPYGITIACTKGQPSHLMMEYFVEELTDAGVDFKNETVFVFTISDWDSAGESIKNNMLKFLKEQAGIENLVTHNLMDLKRISDAMVNFGRTEAMRFYKDANGNPCPLNEYKEEKPTKLKMKFDSEELEPLIPEPVEEPGKDGKVSSKFTRIYNWWNSLGDQKERLISKNYRNGRWEYTIWKVSADAIDWDEVENHYHEVVQGILQEHRKWHKVLRAIGKMGCKGKGGERATKALELLGEENTKGKEKKEEKTNLEAALKVCDARLIRKRLWEVMGREKSGAQEKKIVAGILERLEE